MAKKEKPPKGFKTAFNTAAKIAKDTKRTADLVNAAVEKAHSHRGRFKRLVGDLESLLRLVGAWAKGDYKKVPLQTVVLAIAAIVYFLNPFDLVHDYLPSIGYFDDATILVFVIKSIKRDLDEFLIWEKHT